MLTPRYLESAPDAMVDLYSEVEADILADMARRIARYDFFIPAAEHQLRVLEEMGAEQTYILRRLAELTGRSEAELRQLFEVSGGKALVSDQADYRRAGLHPPALNTSQELQQVLSAGLRQTQGLFTNLTRTTALDSGERFRAVLDRAWLQVSTGGFDANTAIRNAIKELTRQGLTTVDYASGRTMSVEAAVRMNVVTGVNQTALRLQDTLADEMDSDLVETTAHSGARPSHARWQGQVFSRSGKSKKYPDFRRATGYGTGPELESKHIRRSLRPQRQHTRAGYRCSDPAEWGVPGGTGRPEEGPQPGGPGKPYPANCEGRERRRIERNPDHTSGAWTNPLPGL